MKRTLYVAAVIIGLADGGMAATIFQDNFDSETTELNARLDNWRVTRGAVDAIGKGFYDFYPGNGVFLDMDGSVFEAGTIRTRTRFSLVAGETYRIAFSLGVNGTAAERLRFGFADLATFGKRIAAGGIRPGMQQVSRTFTASQDQSAALFFRAFGKDNRGPVLDNVVLTSLSSTRDAARATAPITAVPLPGSLVLAATGLLALLGLGLRRSSPAG
jgi:hypothetical protein